MTDLNSFYKTDAVDDVMAADINVLIASSSYSTFRNVETLTADKDLTDADCPVQVLTPSGASFNVILPDEAITNHQFIILNPTGTSYSIVVKTFGSVSTLATLTAGQMALLVSGGGEYGAVSGTSMIKATGSDVATGTNDDKYVTSKAIKDSVNVPNVAPSTSGNLLTSNGTAWTSTAPAAQAVTLTNSVTLTNKRVTPRVDSVASHATPTINTDTTDAFDITALATAITNMSTNLSGSPTNFQKLIIRIKDNGTAQGITWGTSFVARGAALPSTTVLSKLTTCGFLYNTTTNTWGCVAVAQEN
jgi:hypothetical protein